MKKILMLILVVLILLITGCSQDQEKILVPKFSEAITIENIQIKASPPKYQDNNLSFELSFTTHAGDLTENNWQEIISTDIDGEELELAEYNYLRKSEHHPIVEIVTTIDKETLQKGKQLSLNITGLAGGKNEKISWSLNKLNKFLFPSKIGVIVNDIKGDLWLLTTQGEKKLVYSKTNINDILQINNNNWLIYDGEKGVIENITLSEDFKINAKTLKTSPSLKDIAYFELEKLLFAISENGDNILVINLENGETVLSYKDIIKSASDIEVIGNQLFVSEEDEIKIINFESFMLDKSMSLGDKVITDIKKSTDDKYLFVMDEDKNLKIFNADDQQVVKEIYFSRDYSYDPILEIILVLNKEGNIIYAYNLKNNNKREIQVEYSLKDIAVIPNSKYIYGSLAENNDLVLINSDSEEIIKSISDMGIENLNDNFIILNSN
ncbi:MAG: YncE family protein [Bacillota bacterium]